jgi:hypothetical protein
VDYSDWLNEGVSVASAAVTITTTGTATVDTVSVEPDGRVVFWTNAGTVNEVFTVNVAMTSSIGEIKQDTISFTVVSP